VKIYRLALARYASDKRQVFSGLSGFVVDGRWHSRPRLLDYASQSVSLAALERLVHYKRLDGLAPHVFCSADLPEPCILRLKSPPSGWNALESASAVRKVGNGWHDEMKSAALMVPSAIIPGEFNFLINSRHPDWRWAWVSNPVPFVFDRRILELLSGRSSQGSHT
jgi:RES domain-containing protein